MAKDLETRITELEDREAIKEIRHMYCYYADSGRMAECAALYSDDAIADFGPLGVYRGIDEIRQFYCDTVPSFFSFMLHLVHNHTVRVNGNTGEGSCYFEFKGTSAKGNPLIGAGRYEDQVVKIGGQWKFKRRNASFHFFMPATDSWAEKNPIKLDPADLR